MTQQDEVLERCIELAKIFQTDRVRCFDFWRLENPGPYRKAMNERLLSAANKLGQNDLILVLENEAACNTATGAEAATVLGEVKSPHLMLNWDPGNAASRGETPYPDGYGLLPKDRIGHCHCKDVAKEIRTARETNGLPWGRASLIRLASSRPSSATAIATR